MFCFPTPRLTLPAFPPLPYITPVMRVLIIIKAHSLSLATHENKPKHDFSVLLRLSCHFELSLPCIGTPSIPVDLSSRLGLLLEGQSATEASWELEWLPDQDREGHGFCMWLHSVSDVNTSMQPQPQKRPASLFCRISSTY